MAIQLLDIEGAWVVTPTIHGDARGRFLEVYRGSAFHAATGVSLEVAQVNCSISARGVVRGIHFSDVPPGQGKYVTCVSGRVLDVIVDIRVGSPTFGRWTVVVLDDVERRAVYLTEGLGHGFAALADDSTVVYLCTTPYNPRAEHEVNPLDSDLRIDWQLPSHQIVLSDKDAAAPGLAAAAEAGVLPRYEDCLAHRGRTAARR